MLKKTRQMRPAIWITVEQGSTALVVGAGGGYLDMRVGVIWTFLLSSILFPPLSLSLGDGPI